MRRKARKDEDDKEKEANENSKKKRKINENTLYYVYLVELNYVCWIRVY